jgi:hypothetical protein
LKELGLKHGDYCQKLGPVKDRIAQKSSIVAYEGEPTNEINAFDATSPHFVRILYRG